MNLYMISQDTNTGYDTYDSAVVAAESEDAARRIDPSGFRIWNESEGCWMFVYADSTGKKPTREDWHNSWVSDLNLVKVELIGTYAGTESKLILASFNAG